MKRVYYLSTCDTCKRILKELDLDDTFELINIKDQMISSEDLELAMNKVGGYELLLNKRARKLKDALVEIEIRSDSDYKALILSDYTFLKRPLFILDETVFVGNAKKTVEALKQFISQ